MPIQAQVHAAQVIDKFEDRILSDPLLNNMRDAGSIDDSYVAAISTLREGKTKNDITALPTDNLCRQYLKVWDHLNILSDKDSTLITFDVRRFLVPLFKRKNLLKFLHYSHGGIGKTYATAKSRYY